MDGIKEIFIPSEDFLTDKVNTIKSKFGIIDSLSNTVSAFGDFFDNVAEGKPPKIEIDLSKAESKYDYGNMAYALDMSFYARYKPSVDSVLSSMMWVFFVWRLFVNLPNIVSGVGGGIEASRMSDDIQRGSKAGKRR